MPPAAPLLIQIAVSIAISVALSLVSKLLAPKPSNRSLRNRNQSRTATIRQAISERQLPFGEVVLGGFMTEYEATDNNRYHHMVITLGDAPAAPWDGMDIVWLDSVPVFPSELDGDGNVIAGKFQGKVRIRKLLGGPDQVADPFLIAEVERLDASFRGRGVAAIYVRVDWDAETFPQGLPNVRVLCRTNKVLDPRDATRRWTPNGVLALHEYLTLADPGLGYGASTDIDATATAAGANVADEIVDVRAVGHAVVAADAASNELRLCVAGSGAPLRIETGDRVEIHTTGTAPAGLSTGTAYYAIVDRLVGAPFEDDDASTIALDPADWTGDAASAITAGTVDTAHGTGIHAAIRLASSYANALARSAIDVTDAGSGQHLVIRTGEPRYAVSGVVETARSPKANIDDMLTGIAGRLAWSGAQFAILPAAWRTPVLDLDESDLLDQLNIRHFTTRRERFNTVQGLFASLLTVGEETDYPSVRDSASIAADGGVEIPADIDRPWTSRATTAQRLGKVDLGRARRERVVDYTMTLKGLRAVPGSTVRLSNARRGWVNKTFEVMEQVDIEIGQGQQKLQGVKLKLAETDADIHAFDPDTDEIVAVPKPIPPGGNPLVVGVPGVPSVTEELYVTRDGSGVKALARVAWAASADAFVRAYRVQFRPVGGATWETAGIGPDLFREIRDIEPGRYDFQVEAINQLEVASVAVQRLNVEISGLLAPPANVAGLTLSAIGGLAVLRWTRHPDLDVRIGGAIRFRHAQAQSGASWTGSVSIGDEVGGGETVAVLPLKPGTYLARAFDSSGVPSAAATAVVTSGGTALSFTGLDSVTEHPDFAGSHDGTSGIDGVLKLAGASDIDDWGAVDDVVDLDSEGGLLTAGTYDFANVLDLGTKTRARLTTVVTSAVVNPLDVIDARTVPIDGWEDFDGTGGGEGDVRVEARSTDDDPAGSPTWSGWQRLDQAEFDARAFAFRALLSTVDPAFNIHVSELSVQADEVG